MTTVAITLRVMLAAEKAALAIISRGSSNHHHAERDDYGGTWSRPPFTRRGSNF